MYINTRQFILRTYFPFSNFFFLRTIASLIQYMVIKNSFNVSSLFLFLNPSEARLFFFFFFFLSNLSTPSVGLEVTNPRSRVTWSSNWPSQPPLDARVFLKIGFGDLIRALLLKLWHHGFSLTLDEDFSRSLSSKETQLMGFLFLSSFFPFSYWSCLLQNGSTILNSSHHRWFLPIVNFFPFLSVFSISSFEVKKRHGISSLSQTWTASCRVDSLRSKTFRTWEMWWTLLCLGACVCVWHT